MNKHYVSASYDIITAAIAKTNIKLTEECESYLVFLMAEHFDDPNIGYDSPVAVDWMTAKSMSNGTEKLLKLKKIGDTCLLISSISPFIYNRAGLGPDYFATIGQDCYLTRSQIGTHDPWYALYTHFLEMRDVFEAALLKRKYTQVQLVDLADAGSKTAAIELGATYIPIKPNKLQ